MDTRSTHSIPKPPVSAVDHAELARRRPLVTTHPGLVSLALLVVASLLSLAAVLGACPLVAAAATVPPPCSEQDEIDRAIALIDPHARADWRFRPASRLPEGIWGMQEGQAVTISDAVPCRSLAATMVHEGTHVLQARAFPDPAAVYGAHGVEEIADVAPIVLGAGDGYSPYLCEAAKRARNCSAPPVPPAAVAAVITLLAYR